MYSTAPPAGVLASCALEMVYVVGKQNEVSAAMVPPSMLLHGFAKAEDKKNKQTTSVVTMRCMNFITLVVEID